MTPHYQDPWLTVYHGDARAVMAVMEPESVHCVVTSPPYWGLRDYGQPGQLGLEPTPEAYVESMVAVFREVRRVLRSDGTVWLNLGDSYSSGSSNPSPKHVATNVGMMRRVESLGPKQLVGIPWRVAFALQADGWYLRSDIIWSKPNPMPESVTDRPTKSHEYLFLLSKSARYYFDADAVREVATDADHIARYSGRYREPHLPDGTFPRGKSGPGYAGGDPAGRNIRSVWTVATQPYPSPHFATYPPKLVEPCIKAGTSERGVCPECGAPWTRETRPSTKPRNMERPQAQRAVELSEIHGLTVEHLLAVQAVGITDAGKARVTQDGYGKNTADVIALADEAKTALGGYYREFLLTEPETIGWRPSCRHISPLPARSAVVLDPFAGSGTTGMVAQSLSRRAVLIDLSMDYLGQLMDRNRDIPLGLGA